MTRHSAMRPRGPRPTVASNSPRRVTERAILRPASATWMRAMASAPPQSPSGEPAEAGDRRIAPRREPGSRTRRTHPRRRTSSMPRVRRLPRSPDGGSNGPTVSWYRMVGTFTPAGFAARLIAMAHGPAPPFAGPLARAPGGLAGWDAAGPGAGGGHPATPRPAVRSARRGVEVPRSRPHPAQPAR